MSKQALQLVIVPHRPAHTDGEINADLGPALEILQRAAGLKAIWRGKKFEDRYTQVILLLWQDLASSHAFFTSFEYEKFNKLVQPALNGRTIEWQQHALLGGSELSNDAHLKSILNAPAIEVALTKVVEGGVAGYYKAFQETVVAILNEDPGCDGFFIAPKIENPQDQLLLINWKSVDAHHEDFEKKPTFNACIDALRDYYAVFVVPWHIVGLELKWGRI
ncbi:hypothetical protein K432DRAFT_424984 [Lepidopterella palustris CBS 459.81]|uniref:ABM domain-containing protein n=1 Tax=Lepidopterella palustris CBS 459.81 TaxID=1314670 RepID=A0A8E2JGF3_9PEZI|nr:hypothetical protein K432DRAFT_424984 [Lepidopterella palustris CBS 459.81]